MNRQKTVIQTKIAVVACCSFASIILCGVVFYQWLIRPKLEGVYAGATYVSVRVCQMVVDSYSHFVLIGMPLVAMTLLFAAWSLHVARRRDND